jgi:hypothetical protein
MSEPTDSPDLDATDPDADPANLSPRDDRNTGSEQYDDPDADPEMLNPREP